VTTRHLKAENWPKKNGGNSDKRGTERRTIREGLPEFERRDCNGPKLEGDKEGETDEV